MAIQLKATAIDDLNGTADRRWYYGEGEATIAMDENGKPVGLAYDQRKFDSAPGLSDLPPKSRWLHGIVSCWEFVPVGE